MTPSWLDFLTVAWGQGGTDAISAAESAAVLYTFLLPCSCCHLPVPIPVPTAMPISSVPCFSFTQLGATDLTHTEPVVPAPCTRQGSVAPGLYRSSAWGSAAAPGQGGGSSGSSLHGQVLYGTCCMGESTSEISANGRALMAGQGKKQEKAPRPRQQEWEPLASVKAFLPDACRWAGPTSPASVGPSWVSPDCLHPHTPGWLPRGSEGKGLNLKSHRGPL